MKKLIFILLFLLLLCSAAKASVIVDINGAGDYTSFTQAVYETTDNIVVYPGTYDIHQEYIDFFGEEVTNNLTNETDLNLFQLGVIIKDRAITFMPGSLITCTWYIPFDYSWNFCPIYMYTDATLIGLNLYAEGCLYAIHDDVWGIEQPYTNSYYNCHIVGRQLLNANCIGGGCGKYSRHIIQNCYFDNGCPDSFTIRYHNNYFPDSKGDIWISNSYFNSNIAFCYYGPESNHIDAYINNCTMQGITMKYETLDFQFQNITLHQWNNVINWK